MTSPRIHTRLLNATLLVVGLGYCMDCFDLFLYNALRVTSLTELGLSGDALTKTGIWILNLQVLGMLAGGMFWGVLGDKIGRKQALLGSVLFYSIGSFGCAFVQHVWVYEVLRFVTGIGLAGEIGLGAILVAETMSPSLKDWGICVYALFAYFGLMAANILAGYLSWRLCYAVGGGAGLLLLLARMSLLESGLFEKLTEQNVVRGSLKLFLKNRDLLKRYLCSIFFTIPYFYIVNLLVTLSPEFGKAVGVADPIKANIALLVYSMCAMVGTITATLVCKILRRRILPIFMFMCVNVVLVIYYLTQHQPTAQEFYVLCGIMGLANFFVLLMFTAVEQFGTNMRATAGTSALSTGRSTLVITNSIFLAFRASGFDLIPAATWVGVIVFTIGFLCLLGLRETYHQPMDFIEEKSSS